MTARLDKILARFKATANELDKLAAQADNEIKAHDDEILHHTTSRNALSEEKLQAMGVANKIRALIAA
jgi:hypothetical protein